jgi:hypothetical protein
VEVRAALREDEKGEEGRCRTNLRERESHEE